MVTAKVYRCFQISNPSRLHVRISSFGTLPIPEKVKEILVELIRTWLVAPSLSNLYFGILILLNMPCYVSDHVLSCSVPVSQYYTTWVHNYQERTQKISLVMFMKLSNDTHCVF